MQLNCVVAIFNLSTSTHSKNKHIICKQYVRFSIAITNNGVKNEWTKKLGGDSTCDCTFSLPLLACNNLMMTGWLNTPSYESGGSTFRFLLPINFALSYNSIESKCFYLMPIAAMKPIIMLKTGSVINNTCSQTKEKYNLIVRTSAISIFSAITSQFVLYTCTSIYRLRFNVKRMKHFSRIFPLFFSINEWQIKYQNKHAVRAVHDTKQKHLYFPIIYTVIIILFVKTQRIASERQASHTAKGNNKK